MARVIYKYILKIADEQTIEVPTKSHIKCQHVSLDPNGFPAIWIECDSDGEYKQYKVSMRGTGHLVPTDKTYIGSIHQNPFVWHVFF